MTSDTPAAETVPQPELDLEFLIRQLDAGADRLPVSALRTCQQHRDVVTPRLIEVLEEAVRLAREGKARPGNAHFFALFLLTEFEARQALPVILELFSIREPLLEELLGGAVTETTRRVLAVLAGGQPDLIESLILNRELDDYIRSEAAAALINLVRDGRMSRAEGLERLARQMRAAAAASDIWGATSTVSKLGELNPLELQDEIRELFERGCIDDDFIRWKSFQEYMLQPDQPGVCPRLESCPPTAITDTVAELQTWYGFSEQARQASQAAIAKGAQAAAAKIAESGSGSPATSSEPLLESIPQFRRDTPHVGRNEPCPCGSGKKFKKCCLRAGA